MPSARWIRFGSIGAFELRNTCTGLAAVQSESAQPIVLWGCAREAACLGARGGEAGVSALHAEAQSRDLVWVSSGDFPFAFIAPLRAAPRRGRWSSWALTPALATYRQFGMPAYLDDSVIRLRGRCLAPISVGQIAGCVVVASSFAGKITGADRRTGVPSFRSWLREGAALSRSEWADRRETPAEREVEAALRSRIEAQYDWKFEHSWPSARERAAIERVQAERMPAAATRVIQQA